MWKDAILSPKGQITLPKDVREALGLEPNDRLILTIDEGRLILTPKNVEFSDLAGFLGTPPNGPATLEEIDETIASATSESATASLTARKGEAA
jgi:antitoxin PrlF